MKKSLLITICILFTSFLSPSSGQDLIITGVMDGDLSGGLPKAIEIYVLNDIADLSEYSIAMVYNTNSTSTTVFTFPVTAITAGNFITVAQGDAVFNTYMGYEADYYTSNISGNGDDRYLIMKDGVVLDIFGEFDVDGTGTDWEYIDGFAYRKTGTDADGQTFDINNWDIYKQGLDGFATNAEATTPFPSKSYSPTVSDTEPPVWSDGYPQITDIRDIGGDLWVSMDEPGIVYYVILDDGSDPPTSEEVKAGIDYSTTIVLKSGNFEVAEANTPVTELLDGAMPETAYDIYVVAEDVSENLQTSPYRFDVITGPPRTISITTPVEFETYFVGQAMTFEWTSTNIDFVEIIGYHFRHQGEFAIAADAQGFPVSVDASLGEYDYTIPLDAASDSVSIIIRNAQDWTVADTVTPVFLDDIIAPVIEETLPENQAIDQLTTTTVKMIFNEEIFPGTGKLYFRNDDGTLFEELDIASEGDGENLDIVGDGYELNATPSSPFFTGNTYYLELDQGIVMDYFDNDFAGFTGSTTLSFTIVKGSDASLADLMVDGLTIDGFAPGTLDYIHPLTSGTTEVPAVTATASDPNADITITPAINLDGTEAERTTTVAVIADDESASNNYTITFEVATSVFKTFESNIHIYPVPVYSVLTIENITMASKVEILDLTGSVVYEKILSREPSQRINVESLPKGIYFLKLSDDKEFITRKFIKR